MNYDELLKFSQSLFQSLLAENAVFRRENALLRKELHRYLVLDIQRTWLEMSDEEADARAEMEITHMVLHNEGAE